MFDQYGRTTGFGQIAPGRDVEAAKVPGQPGRPRNGQPNIGSAITGGIPMGGATPFAGARQTLQNPGIAPSNQGPLEVNGQPVTPQTGGFGPSVAPPVDSSQWKTDGFGTPQYTAKTFGAPLAGWDAKKWNDPNHQTPKYVWGRITAEAGDLKDPAKRDTAVKNLLAAYPGSTFNGKDKVTLPDGRQIDIFGGASRGEYTPAWQDLSDAPAGPAPGLQQAILGTAPTVGGSDYASRLRQQVMQSLQATPGLAELARMFG